MARASKLAGQCWHARITQEQPNMLAGRRRHTRMEMDALGQGCIGATVAEKMERHEGRAGCGWQRHVYSALEPSARGWTVSLQGSAAARIVIVRVRIYVGKKSGDLLAPYSHAGVWVQGC